jgi:sugar phosphate permease
VSGWLTHVRRQGLAVTVCASAWGVAIVLFGLTHQLWLALVFLAVAGGADFFSAVLRSVMLMNAAPDHLRGRLFGIEFTQVAGAPNLGNIEAGVVASLAGLRASVVSGGALCVVGCIATAAALPRFLRYDASQPQQS